MKNLLNYLALKSYLIVKVVFSLAFMLLVICYSFGPGSIPHWLLNMFFLLGGVFVGYSIAYFSIKRLQSENES